LTKDVFLRTGFIVSGFVTDGFTGEGIMGCWVDMWDPTTGAWNHDDTDSSGSYSFYLPTGSYEFSVGPPPYTKYQGYWETGIEVNPGFTKDVELYPVMGGRGGWRYDWNYEDSDNSVTQWPIIGLEAAEANWGIEAPDFVKTELDLWLKYSQSATGGFGYSAPENWVNPAKTGAGLCGLAYIGLPPTDTRVVRANDYLDSQWDTSGTDGYWGNYYALYAIAKGCRLFDPEINYIGTHDWYGDDPGGFARYLVDEQWADGRWPTGVYAGHTLANGWAILILTPTVTAPPPVADAGPDITYGPDYPVYFDGSGSYHLNPARTIVLYEWDFESDGIYDYNSTEPYAEHVYPTYYKPDGTIDDAQTYRDYLVTLRVTDNDEPPKTDTDTCIVHITPPPHPPIADPDGPYEGCIGQTITLDGTGSFDIDSGAPWFDNIVSYGWELDGIYPYDFDDAFGATVGWIWGAEGTYLIGLEVADTTDLTGVAWTTVKILPNVAPTVDSIDAPVDPVKVGTSVTATATFTDPDVTDTHTATWDWGDGYTSPGTVNEDADVVTGSHVYDTPGVYTINIAVTDSGCGAVGSAEFEYVVVYDPEGGFVTGGGWIDSPEGAYTIDPTLTGKATFGFVSKYKKGASTPTGETEFRFHAADFNFHSTNYQWLVVAGARAQFKGYGAIKGWEGECGFILTAVDGQIHGGGGVDKFRIKIWDRETGEIIYDNQLGDADDAGVTYAIAGGSIAIHKGE